MSSTEERLIQPTNSIKRVVCSGGGAKGVVYPAAYKAMQQTGVLDTVEHFSGASAGAITAALMAVGIQPEHFRKTLLETNFKSLMGNKLTVRTPGTCRLTKDGSTMLAFLRKMIADSIDEQLTANREELFARCEDQQQREKLQALITNVRSEQPNIRFSDLAFLNQLAPEIFKKLTVTAVTFPNGELQVFDTEHTGDVEIALACRASASIPVVLEPVDIVVNGVAKRFVDGGMYDNLPTDYFDYDETHQRYLRNQHKQQTLVFAFGEGLNNAKNPVNQGLYGTAWDESIVSSFLDSLIDSEMLDATDDWHAYCEAVKLHFENALALHVREQTCDRNQARKLMASLEQALDSLTQKPEAHERFWFEFEFEKDPQEKAKLVGEQLKGAIAPTLYKAGWVEHIKRNVLTEKLGDLQLAYRNTEQKEIGYQKLKRDYPLRTVELRTGTIKTTQFDKATKLARVMDALGYLDTMNHIVHHELYKEGFEPNAMYQKVADNFLPIYKAILLGSGQQLKDSPIACRLHQLYIQHDNQKTPAFCREMIALIKQEVERQPASPLAFALSRAIEFSNGELTPNDLFKETYLEAFKNSSWLSRSTVAKSTFFRTSSLASALESQNMFALAAEQKAITPDGRTQVVLQHLSKLPDVKQQAEIMEMDRDMASHQETHEILIM